MNIHKVKDSAPIFSLIILAVLFGYLVGRIADVQLASASTSLVVRPATQSASVPVVIIDGIKDGQVIGSISGPVRFWVGPNQVLPQADGQFAADPGPLLINNISVLVPPGMNFVASKRGQKYYPVTSKAAANINPANRIYFATEAEAEEAGYLGIRRIEN